MTRRMTLPEQIRDLVNAQGADEVTVTLDDDQALRLARFLDILRDECPDAKSVGAVRRERG